MLGGPASTEYLGGPKCLGGPNFNGGTSNPCRNPESPGLGVTLSIFYEILSHLTPQFAFLLKNDFL